MDALVQVRPASIPRWNEHKDVKEDKERDPCVFGPHGRNLAVDSKVSKFQTQKSAKEKNKNNDIQLNIEDFFHMLYILIWICFQKFLI